MGATKKTNADEATQPTGDDVKAAEARIAELEEKAAEAEARLKAAEEAAAKAEAEAEAKQKAANAAAGAADGPADDAEDEVLPRFKIVKTISNKNGSFRAGQEARFVASLPPKDRLDKLNDLRKRGLISPVER